MAGAVLRGGALVEDMDWIGDHLGLSLGKLLDMPRTAVIRAICRGALET
jgi:hypothetical protein